MEDPSEGAENSRENSDTVVPDEDRETVSSETDDNLEVSRVQYLTTPVKPDNEKKEYKAIELANGLKALLIVDCDDDFNVRHDFQGACEGSVMSSSCERIGSHTDLDPTSKNAKIQMACFALSIGVGSYKDPPGIPGMARFLEHMILENDFDAFVKQHGGYLDASTGSDETTFKVTIPIKLFYDALNRFAQLFTVPFLKRDAVSRVRQFIIKRDNVTNKELYEKLEKFRKCYYRAHNMTVTVEGRLQLHTLQKYVEDCFASFISDSLSIDYLTEFTGADLFHISAAPWIYQVATKAYRRLEMIWTIPTHYFMHSSKPLKYISWLICNNGKGSLISYLRKKRFCMNISSDFGKTRYISSNYYTKCNLCLDVTRIGFRNWSYVVSTVYNYISFMQREGPQKEIYDENRKIIEAKYRFSGEEESIDPSDICKNMHSNSPNDYVTGSNLHFEYDPDFIKTCLDLLMLQNASIIIYADFPGSKMNKFEPWFKMKYALYPLSENFITDEEQLQMFTFLEANVFVADDFTLIPVSDDLEYPIKIHSDAMCEIWYKPDSKFRLPRGYLYFHYISPLPLALPENAVMLDLFVTILKDLMFEDFYPATVAELNYRINSSEKGLTVEVDGFNQKLTLLMIKISNYIAHFSDLVTEDLFKEFSKEMCNYFRKRICIPDELAEDTRLSITRHTHWNSSDKLKAVASIELDRFKNFTKSFAFHIYIQCLVQGNLENIEAIQSVQDCVAILGCIALHPGARPRVGIIEISEGIICCRFKNLDPKDPLSVVKNYYQFFEVLMTTAIELINIITNDILFEEFRTLERLDCSKYRLGVDRVDVFGYSVTSSDLSKNADEIDVAIETFRKTLNAALTRMTEEELVTAKRALLRNKQSSDFSLKDEVKKNWAEIISGTYCFDRIARDVNTVNRLAVKELKQLLINLTSDTPSLRKLSIQIIGNNTNETEDNSEVSRETKDTDDWEKFATAATKLEYLTDLPNAEEKPDNYFILDIDDYKMDRRAFTVYRS